MKGVMEPSSNRNNYILTWWNSSRIAAVSRFRLVLMDSAVVSQLCPHWMSRGAAPWSKHQGKTPGGPADLGSSHQMSADSLTSWRLLKEQRERGMRKELRCLSFFVPSSESWMLLGKIQGWPFPNTGNVREDILHCSVLFQIFYPKQGQIAIWLSFPVQISMRYRKLFSPLLQTLHPVKKFSLLPSDDDLHNCVSIFKSCLKISIAWQCTKRTIVGVFFVSGSLFLHAFLSVGPRH